ncbi:hypothetical protein A2160_03145 [Candidatus Beckwithbacteria bacterium RBG_13_42_9]|uniref:Major facilitator superfamily (MFS) profile domain-containing protein n=1 Tax=Candidatus Beckwithbacteria bacterium RBG_13_42_9 TaxID=1797457 RepID=A0A1F5E7T1_9BACT|nr:MAG: hypothetical protein A2160_03145 [Candidatus Beckwithbacteria bacterium RBG_13_42_9]
MISDILTFPLVRVRDINRNIVGKDVRTVYYVVTALRDLAVGFVSATYALFLLSKGLTILEMNLVNVFFMVGNFVFEIPTGVYADFFGRKKSVVIHGVLLGLSGLVYFFSNSFWYFVAAELLAALAYTFISGALDAWLADNVGENWVGRTDYIFSQGQVFSKVALIVGGMTGAYFGSLNLAYPWFLVFMSTTFMTLIAAMYMKNDSPTRAHLGVRSGVKQMMKIAKDSFSYGLGHPVVLWLIITTFVSFLAFQPLNMFWAPRFSAMAGGQVSVTGWVWAVMSAMMLAGSYLTRLYVKKRMVYWKIMILSVLLMAVPVLLSSVSPMFLVAVGFFVVHEVGRGIDRPMKISYINQYLPADKRATLLSFDSMVGKIAAALGLIGFGWLAQNSSFAVSWMVSGLMLLTLIPLYLQVKKKEENFS